MSPLTRLLTIALVACSASAAPARNVSPSVSNDDAAAVRAALAGAARKDRERARDVHRHPAETLEFFGLRSDMNVVELWPGRGYYTAILAPFLAEHGRFATTYFDPNGVRPLVDPGDARDGRELLARLDATPAVFGRVQRVRIDPTAFSFGPDGSADLVVTFRSVHNWLGEKYADAVFAAAYRVLRPGGALGVTDHRAAPGTTLEKTLQTGYVTEDLVISLATQAGFRLAARSEINANPKDTKDHPNGVWSLPPTLMGKDVDREKYVAIGESDRMTLRFTKP